MPPYTLIRTDRRTLAVQVKGEEVIVRAPRFASGARIDAFIAEHEDWIEKQLNRNREALRNALPPLSEEELKDLTARAKTVIPERVRFYAEQMGVTVGRITVRRQKTRWGSCNARGDLNFNCLLLLTPPEVLDSVVVHELCHRKEMNHSARFYREVYRFFPGYPECSRWLKKNGGALLRSMR